MKKTFSLTFLVLIIFTIINCPPPGSDDGLPCFNELIKLTASDADNFDFFGWSVSISGDYALVGAYSKDGYGDSRGSAYIFDRYQGGDNNWGEVKKLTASDAEDRDFFGSSVAISGDYAIVGAPSKNGGGAAYIFYRHEGGLDNWGEVKKLTASDAEEGDRFGCSVAVAWNCALVGARYEDGAGERRGAAYIYYWNQGGDNNWGEVKKLTASDAGNSDYFGGSVSLAGDYVLVGARCEDGAGDNRGAAYIYYRYQGGDNNWGEVKKLTAGDAADSDFFGSSVAISEDYALVGAPDIGGEDNSRGSAYIFYRHQGGDNNWGEVKKLTAGDSEDWDDFGSSLDISGDYVLVGAEKGNGYRGAAYIYFRNQGGVDNWGHLKKLTASDAEDSDFFGWSVSISGDYVIVGAHGEDGTGQFIGAAYIFEVQ
jgi:hypothetical protein